MRYWLYVVSFQGQAIFYSCFTKNYSCVRHIKIFSIHLVLILILGRYIVGYLLNNLGHFWFDNSLTATRLLLWGILCRHFMDACMIASTFSHVINARTTMKCCGDFSSGNYSVNLSNCLVQADINNNTFRGKLISSEFCTCSLLSEAVFCSLFEEQSWSLWISCSFS